MVNWELFINNTLQEFFLLLIAPLFEPAMWWIITPLIVTFLAMTFYFGLYKQEELGWNSALGNIIVLLFICIDLFRTIYYYSFPPSIANFLIWPWKSLAILVIFFEAFLLAYFAFTHAIPKKFMFFIASPLPVNLQAYVIISFVYLRFEPTRYTLPAALLLFTVLLLLSKMLQLLQRVYVERGHREQVQKIKALRKEANTLLAEARKKRDREARKLREQANKKKETAKRLEKALRDVEHQQHGELRAAKKL